MPAPTYGAPLAGPQAAMQVEVFQVRRGRILIPT